MTDKASDKRPEIDIDGILVPIVTPFHADGSINYPVLETLIERLLQAGVQGIVACGSTGEYYALNEAEREDFLAFVSQTVGERARLIAGVNDTHPAGSIMRSERAKAWNYQGLMLSPPIYCLPSQREIVTHYQTVSAELEMPIIMYNFPARSGVEIGIEAVKILSRDPCIVGIKESSGDFSRALALMNLEYENFQVVCGSDDQAADYLFWGVRSWIAGAANYLPEAHLEMMAAARENDFLEVRRIMQQILPVIQNMESSEYNQKAKLGCQRRGIAVGEVRAPLQPVSETDKNTFLQTLDKVLQSMPATQ